MVELASVALDDKYTLASGRIYVSGTQALARLPLLQRARDGAAGLNTAGFISGYRGSPLGGYDLALWQAQAHLRAQQIHFQPGINEDLAATAVWGTQQVGLGGRSDYDGVFALWYGKSPGVDRSGDAFKHGNLAGTAPHGGVLVLFGDDHIAKSSSAAAQSEPALMAAHIPFLNPANVQEYLDYGLIGIALSRYAGCWVGMKCVTDTVESSGSVEVDPQRVQLVEPQEFILPPEGVHIRWPDSPLAQEQRLLRLKLPAVQAFARANRLDRASHDLPREQRRLGIVTSGKSWADLMHALQRLGLNEAARRELGLSVYKVALPWPLEPEGVREFALGQQELLVVEEKRGLIEEQLATILYHQPQRPRLVGKRDEAGQPLLPAEGELGVDTIAAALVARLARLQPNHALLQRLQAALPEPATGAAGGAARAPWFCAGCPHNTSTRVPEGSRAFAGIGCHGMAMWMPNRPTESFTHMGGEGAQWIGQAPFSKDKHAFQNLGDGTYYHSGLMAIRAAIAAGINITYKILYNDAVAMTGGQPVEGQLTPWAITQQLRAEGVKRIAVVMDDPQRYPADVPWAQGVTLHHRREFDALQHELRETPGTTVLLYDQTCAAEKRRRRKRGKHPDPAQRVFINDAVCEGCGDCGLASNCVAIKPLPTEFGRKRAIDQSSCNKDYSCVDGFCPSFITVRGGSLRKPAAAGAGWEDPAAGLPEPQLPSLAGDYNILVTGVGGTGVVTIGALLGMAAHLEGKGVSVLDQTGLAQKNGAVSSHVRLASESSRLQGTRIARGETDLVLGCDMVVAAGQDALATYAAGRTHAVINDHVVPLAAFAINPDLTVEERRLLDSISTRVGRDRTHFVAAHQLAVALMGDAIYSNPFLLGYAWQQGLIPLSREALEHAIALNGVAVTANKAAFAWGRRAAYALHEVEAVARPQVVEEATIAGPLEEIIARRVEHLTRYQDAAYAGRYSQLVARAQEIERARLPDEQALTRAVAYNYAKLLAYKDEYEVARLHSDPSLAQKLAGQFEGDFKLSVHLAPPLLAKRDPRSGLPRKQEFGPWMFKVFGVLARFRFLRGTPLDPFGYTGERKQERQLIREYEALVAELLERLAPTNHALAIELATLPEQIRGFGHVKERHLQAARRRQAELLGRLREGTERRQPTDAGKASAG
jgi:indolepyruvate ferredoxin oxidoreductase